jgi:hypothetical protein
VASRAIANNAARLNRVGNLMRTIQLGLCALAALASAGWACTTHVVPTGSGTYLVAAHGTMGWSSGPAQKAKAFEEAAAYCKESGKELLKVFDQEPSCGTAGCSSGSSHGILERGVTKRGRAMQANTLAGIAMTVRNAHLTPDQRREAVARLVQP